MSLDAIPISCATSETMSTVTMESNCFQHYLRVRRQLGFGDAGTFDNNTQQFGCSKSQQTHVSQLKVIPNTKFKQCIPLLFLVCAPGKPFLGRETRARFWFSRPCTGWQGHGTFAAQQLPGCSMSPQLPALEPVLALTPACCQESRQLPCNGSLPTPDDQHVCKLLTQRKALHHGCM